MIYVGWMVMAGFVILAIISRIHFSKYKGKRGKIPGMLFYAMAEKICGILERQSLWETLKNRMRKLNVVSDQALETMVKKRVIGTLAPALFVVFLAACLTIVCCLSVVKGIDDNTIEREKLHGSAREQEIELTYGNETEEYRLDISQQTYSEEEFYEAAKQAFLEADHFLEETMEADGCISSDIRLPEDSGDGLIRLTWESSDTNLITDFGTVEEEELPETPEPVVLTATAAYEDYQVSETFGILVGKRKLSELCLRFEEAKKKLGQIEEENRHTESFTLPETLGDVQVRLIKPEAHLPEKVFLLGLLAGAIMITLSFSRLSEKERIRDRSLENEYPAFVNKLQLLLEAGMTAKQAFYRLSQEKESCIYIINELRYSLNEIDTGMHEAKAYERLGERLSLPVYRRLMTHISQNLKLGSRHLSELLEQEVNDALLAQKENIKKQGEEVSSKLLFPMVLLLFITMLIVIAPAMLGM